MWCHQEWSLELLSQTLVAWQEDYIYNMSGCEYLPLGEAYTKQGSSIMSWWEMLKCLCATFVVSTSNKLAKVLKSLTVQLFNRLMLFPVRRSGLFRSLKLQKTQATCRHGFRDAMFGVILFLLVATYSLTQVAKPFLRGFSRLFWQPKVCDKSLHIPCQTTNAGNGEASTFIPKSWNRRRRESALFRGPDGSRNWSGRRDHPDEPFLKTVGKNTHFSFKPLKDL